MVGSRVGRSGMIGLGLWVLGNTFVPHISNIAGVAIGNIVGDNLGAAIRKGNTVLSSSVVAIPLLILGKGGSRVGVSHSVLIGIGSRGIIISWGFVRSWLVSWSWGICWGWLVSWSRFVNRCRWSISRGVRWGCSGHSTSSKDSNKSLKIK